MSPVRDADDLVAVRVDNSWDVHGVLEKAEGATELARARKNHIYLPGESIPILCGQCHGKNSRILCTLETFLKKLKNRYFGKTC